MNQALAQGGPISLPDVGSANNQGTGIKYSGSYGTQVSRKNQIADVGTTHIPYTCCSTTRMAQTTPVVMAHGMEEQASVGFKSKGYAILGIQFNAIATQLCKNKIEAIGTVCMQACGSACLATQLKREKDLGSDPGSLDISPAQCLFDEEPNKQGPT